MQSLPSWERGLKYSWESGREPVNLVAPFVGAWIEIFQDYKEAYTGSVAPFVGAWIEMLHLPLGGCRAGSRSLRGSVD